MTIVYRETDPISARWTANSSGIDLSAFQIDQNFYEAISRIATLEANATLTVSIASITISGDALTFHMTDLTTQGPFTIPVATFNDRGSWQPVTVYNVNDTFNINGTLYLVIFAHTSAASFSAGANDGAGHNYYSALVSVPGSALPTGGATAQVLQKASGTDFAVTWGYKLPTGGTQYQVLMKNSATNQDANWTTLDALHVSFSPSTASALTSTNVAAALEELKADIAGAGVALHGLTDVNVTEGSGINGYFLQWNNATGKWLAAAAASNLSGLADVNVTEGSGINGQFLQWDNGSGKWIAAASSASLSGLSDVNITEGSGINGDFLQWNNGAGKWVAATVSLSGLADVNVTEGSGINGYFLKWDNASSKWLASLTGATAVALSGLSDVNVTEGAGIDGLFLKWNNGSSKWIASAGLLASNNLSDLANAATARSNLGVATGSVEVVIDGGGSTITTGIKGYVRMPFAGALTESTLLADQSGSIVVNVWKCTYAQFDAGATHPVVGDKITASAPPTISSATKADDNTLTGWTTAFSAGDILGFNVDSVTTIQRVTLSLKYTK